MVAARVRAGMCGLLLAGALVSCSGDGNDSQQPASAPSSSAPAPRDAGAPDVAGAVVADLPSYDIAAEEVSKKTVSGQAGPEKLTLTTKGPGGVRYSLEIPAGAFVLPTEVSMTPLSGVSGFGDGVGADGVKLRPEGVNLIEPATLTVTGGAADAAGATAWESESLQDARLAWVDPSDQRLRIEVTHFSEKVVAHPKPPNWSRTVDLSSSATAELQTAIAMLEYVVDQTAVLDRDGELTQAERTVIVDTANDFLTLYIERLTLELGSMSAVQTVAGLQALEATLDQMLAVERRLALLGEKDGSVVAALIGLTDLARQLADALARFCVEEHSPEAGVAVLGVARRYGLLGGSKEGIAAMQAAAENCFEIEVLVQIDSQLCLDGRCSNQHHSETKFQTTVGGPPLTVPVGRGSMTLEKAVLTMSSKAKPVPPLKVPRPDTVLVKLRVQDGDLADFINSYAGPGGSTYQVDYFDPLLFVYQDGWEMGGTGRTLATFVHQQRGDAGYESVIVIEIRHSPRGKDDG